jgi:Ca-activated chloride channel family protein
MPMLPLVLWLLAMQPPAAAPQRLTSNSELVVVNVTVVDGKAKYVDGLPREAFAIFEDGRPQPLGFFESADTAATIGLIVDNSTSMHRRRDAIIAAGMSFAASSHPDDELFTINFNENVWRGLPDGQLFTTDREELQQALSKIQARGQTALFDGLDAALDQLEKGHKQKKVLVVVSDGGDNASRSSFESVLQKALRMDAVIYTVSIRDDYDKDGKPDVLRKISAATGGESYFLRDVDHVAPTFDRIARDIRSGYTLGYTPEPGSGYRRIKVRVQPPDSRRLTVRCRSGYER